MAMSNQRLERWFSAYTTAAAVSGAVIGLFVLIARHVEIRFLKFVVAGLGGMTGNTALCLALLGIALHLCKDPARQAPWRNHLARGAALWVALLAALSFAEWTFGFDAGIDTLINGAGNERFLRRPPDVPGRIAFLASVTLALMSGALVFLDARERRIPLGRSLRPVVNPSQVLILAALWICYLHLVNYTFPVAIRRQMAGQTAVCLTFLALGILSARPQRGLMAVLASDSQGGMLMRRLLPAVLLIPLGLAWTRSQEMVAQLYGPTVALSLTVALAVGLLVAIVWNTGALLHQADLQRRAAEGDLLRAYDELETRVAQRTRDLSQANEELRQAMERIRTLSGLLPICAWCKKVRDDNGYWSQIETYLRQHSQAEFTHGICPECAVRMKALR